MVPPVLRADVVIVVVCCLKINLCDRTKLFSAFLRERMSRPDCERGLLLTDFPRTADQVAGLNDLLAQTFGGAGITRCIELFLPPTTAAINEQYVRSAVPIMAAYEEVHTRIDATQPLALVTEKVLGILDDLDLGLDEDEEDEEDEDPEQGSGAVSCFNIIISSDMDLLTRHRMSTAPLVFRT